MKPPAMLDSVTDSVNLGVITVFIAAIVHGAVSWVIATVIKTHKTSPVKTKTNKSKTHNPPLPPKAKHAWPIIGHLHKKLDHTTLGSMADEYGPIFTVQLGGTPAVVVSSSEVAREIFTTHDLAVLSQPTFMAVEYYGYNSALLGFTEYGPYWREMRKVTSVHLLSKAKVESFKHIRGFEVEESVRELYKLWMKKKKEEGELDGSRYLELVEMKQRVVDLAFNITVRMVSGKRYYGSSGNNAEAKMCQEAIREFFDKIGTFLLADSFPFLRWFDLGGHEKSIQKKSKELDAIVQGWLDEHRIRMQRNQTSSKDRDFMDVLLRILDGTPQVCGYDSDTVIKATCVNMILGGSDTTTVTLTWALSLLLNNPHALRKAQDELDAQVGRERQVAESDINNLPYLQAIVKETLRLYPPPLSSPRQFTQDCIVAGYHVPKGSRLIVNLYKIHRDPRVWSGDGNATEFLPERFLSGGSQKDMDIRGRGRQFEFMPFGAGRRMCPGSNMALAVVHLALASFLHAFDFSTDAPVNMEEAFGLTVMRANPLNALLAPRLPPHLYV